MTQTHTIDAEPRQRFSAGAVLPVLAGVVLGVTGLVAAQTQVQRTAPDLSLVRAATVAVPANGAMLSTPPPAVAPVALVKIPPATARAANAAVPFALGPITSAAAFRFAGGEQARGRAADCLAAAVLYEAGDDAGGQQAVAQVVLNRARHPAFPKTVCGVVFQGSERRTGCQFTFTCDGALARRYSDAAWSRARQIATAAIGGKVDNRVGLATHYHTDWVLPYWSPSLQKIAAVDTHLFFRWPGAWGTSPAFRSRTNGDEPLVRKLAALSSAHRDAATPALVGMPTDDGRVSFSLNVAPAKPKSVAAFDNSLFIAAPAGASPDSLKALALQQCGERDYCKLFGWTKAALVPANGALNQAAVAGMSFSYLRNRSGGFERALFNCNEFAGVAPKDCMKGR